VDDRSTVDALVSGDADAWQRLVEHETPRVFRTCYRILGRVDVAEDAAQETFIAAYRAIGSYRGEGSAGAWLCRIATRESWRRAASERRSASLLSPLEQAAEHELRDGRDPLTAALSAEQAEQIRRAVAALPEPYREVISLRFLSELSIEDVAAVMQRPIGTVKAQLHRGQSRLRQQIGRMVPA
jgi:RNA polymerase sigma-70 factor (ECF subfamily)